MVGSNKRAPPIAGKAAKKSRSKSIGPGGLDALMSSSGNRRKVRKPRTSYMAGSY
jgi:kinetochore protein Spc7/SPC105